MITFPHLGYIGRLGNQMFQYAALLGISRKHKVDFYLPSTKLEIYKAFNIKFKITSYFNKDFVSTNGLTGSSVVDYTTVLLNNQEEWNSFLSTNFDYNFFNTNHNNKSIFGFFQNYRYFENVENELRSQFTFKQFYRNIANSYFKQKFPNTKVLSLHIRRTDYLESSVLNNLSFDYYENALSKFNKSTPVLVFSDDIDWCENQSIFSDERFIFMKSNNTYIDLCLMSLCNYHIIANSSFSWWGSWLAKSEKTISPKQWFSPNFSHLDSEGLRLSNWIVI